MRNLIVVAVGLGLAGCSSMSLPSMPSMPSFGLSSSSAPPPGTTIQLESLPVGAEAKTSTGASCKTPCSLPLPAAENFSVTFTLPKHKPETVAVQVTRQQDDIAAPDSQGASTGPALLIEPNPIYAELQPGGPAPKGRASTKPAPAPKAKRPPAEPSPFPPPPSR